MLHEHKRVTLYPVTPDLDISAKRLTQDFIRENPTIRSDLFSLSTAKAYETQGPASVTASAFESALDEILLNPIIDQKQPTAVWTDSSSVQIERRFRPGMTDNAGRALEEALAIRLGVSDSRLFQARRLDLYCIKSQDETLVKKLCAFLSHPLLHTTRDLKASPSAEKNSAPQKPVSDSPYFTIRGLDDRALEAASASRLWALSLQEMRAIQSYYEKLGREARIGEMEVLAQTWSEHCKHKIFRGTIEYSETRTSDDDLVAQPRPSIPATTKGLFKTTIKSVTDANPKPWLLSVFSDNAGIVGFTPDDAVCIKVETHNSPSAIDPFAGAITGIGGVHRDIIGTGFGAKPIFNLDVFCVAPAKFDLDRPDGILPPTRILEGVRAGVEAGGNPAGIPTIAGALVFDSSYLGKPLVYCGSGGILPRKLLTHPLQDCSTKEINPGDRIVMVGGRVGRDGIHGATFSSLKLDTGSAALSNATVVQLGDPFTQKRALDFLLVARDLGLYRTLTDNGAGGLSSSVGELATLSGGASLDLTNAPLKALDLRPEEVLISESQERMSLAVPKERISQFLELATQYGVEASDLGEFTNHGRFEVTCRGETVAELDLEFLHNGCPDLKLQAQWTPSIPTPFTHVKDPTIGHSLLQLLSSDNIATKESLIRQYDHEVQGTSLIKPETQIRDHRSPNQAAAVIVGNPKHGIAAVVGVGVLPEYSRYDTYTMAQASLDEAVRNVLSSGAEFGTENSVLALLDNFCWPDPVSNEKYAADLVRAGYGLRDAALKLGLPFVSGKDSMKNDFRGKKDGKDVNISVLPTVLVTALGRITDLKRARTSEFKNEGDLVFLLGPRRFSLLGSQFERIGLTHSETRILPPSDWDAAVRIYSWLGSERSKVLRSCADISEGGVLTALSESLFAYQLGFEASSDWIKAANLTALFGEGFHSFIVSIRREDELMVKNQWVDEGISFEKMGHVTSKPFLTLGKESFSVEELEQVWRSK